MPSPNTQPRLIRANAIVTAVGVADPSLTLAEFHESVGILLAAATEHSSFRERTYFEDVMIWRLGGGTGRQRHFSRVSLGNARIESDHETTEVQLGVLCSNWTPTTFLLSRAEHTRLRNQLLGTHPGLVLQHAFGRAHRVVQLRSETLRLWRRWETDLKPLGIYEPWTGPSKETVRISLPPKPSVKQTVRLQLPPRKPPPET